MIIRLSFAVLQLIGVSTAFCFYTVKNGNVKRVHVLGSPEFYELSEDVAVADFIAFATSAYEAESIG